MSKDPYDHTSGWNTNTQPRRYALIQRNVTNTADARVLLESDDPGAVLVAAMNASEDAAYPDGNTVMIRDRLLERERSVCVSISDSVKRDAALRKKGKSARWEWKDIELPLRPITLRTLRESAPERFMYGVDEVSAARIVEKVRNVSGGEMVELTREEAAAIGIGAPVPKPAPEPPPPAPSPQPVGNL